MKSDERALKKGWITSEQQKAARSLQEKGDPRRPELIIFQQGWIGESQMFELLRESLSKAEMLTPQERPLLEDVMMAKMAIKKKWLSTGRVSSIFRYRLELLSKGVDRSFLDIGAFEGSLPEARKQALQEEFSRQYFVCPSCALIIPLARVKKKQKFQCPRCKGVYQQQNNKNSKASIRAIKTTLSIPSPSFDDPFEKKNNKERYDAREKIGQGGIGSIYRIYDHNLHRLVALKVIRQDKNYSEKSLKRFIGEARILAKLEHPNIVPVHEIGYTNDGRPYFTMKYVRGRALSEVMERFRKGDDFVGEEFYLEKLLQIFLSVCQAIIFSHAHGVLHRDLKPANIMLGAFGEVLVMDWGLAKTGEKEESPYGDMIDLEENTQETSQGKMLGTVHYIPPEQVFNEPGTVDERSDTYSLGAMLYEILTFLPPFVGKEKKDLVQDVLTADPPRPSTIARRKVPYELEAICLKALSKDKNRRYQTALELYEDVENFLAHRPVLAAPSGPVNRAFKWMQRNKLVFISIFALFTIVLLLSPILGFAMKAALIGAAVIMAAAYTFVFYDEARRRAVQLERKLKSSEKNRRDLEAQISKMERLEE